MMLREADRRYILATVRRDMTMEVSDSEIGTWYQDACDLLGNLTHYYGGRSHETDDVVTVMKVLAGYDGKE